MYENSYYFKFTFVKKTGCKNIDGETVCFKRTPNYHSIYSTGNLYF